jgi:putative hydrolase of the HAD superfamily
VDVLLEWHREHPPEISLYPDARRFLTHLARAGTPIVLLTDGRSTTQRHKIDALGISSVFTSILISEETGLTKIDAKAFSNAAAHHPRRHPLTYFGDNPSKDVDHPMSMGWQVFLMLNRGDNVHPQVLKKAQRGVEILSTFDDITVNPNLIRQSHT